MFDYVIELPHHAGEDTSAMGGLTRLMQLANELWTIELPHYHFAAGGIRDSIIVSETLKKMKFNVCLRFQKRFPNVDYDKENFKIPYSVGLPDSTFPASKRVITYSDTPYGNALTALPQVKKVGILMLSYGMMIERELANVKNPKMIVMTTTKRTKRLIEKEGVTCHQVGFGTDYQNFYPEPNISRKKFAFLLYNPFLDKRYEFGVDIANKLCDERLIDGVITFGMSMGYKDHKHPKKLIRHVVNAKRAEIRELFSSASLFIMPSVTEGLNLTPMEAVLCECPAILCDGAIDDIYFDEQTCLIAQKDNFAEIYEKSKKLLLNEKYKTLFRINMLEKIKEFSWEKTVKNILKVMA